MSRLRLRVFVRIAHPVAVDKEAPLPIFLQEYDSVRVRWWGCAKNINRRELAEEAEVFPERLSEPEYA